LIPLRQRVDQVGDGLPDLVVTKSNSLVVTTIPNLCSGPSSPCSGVDLARWKCLIGSEIAGAEVHRHGSEWIVVPSAVGVYEAEELSRALPTPADAEIQGSHPVDPQAVTSSESAAR